MADALRDKIAAYLCQYDGTEAHERYATELVALVRAHATSDAAVERAWKDAHPLSKARTRAAIAAALGG